MQFVDTVPVAGNPPVTAEGLRACKRALARFAERNDVPLPLDVDWRETPATVEFVAVYDGRKFGIAAPKV